MHHHWFLGLHLLGLMWLVVLDAKEIWEALAACGITPSKVEHYLGMDRRQFSRQLDGPEHLRHATLEKLPLSFHREYHWRMVLKLGLPEHVKKSVLPALCYRGARRQLKMHVAEKESKTA